jgi:serine/threonine protein kinase
MLTSRVLNAARNIETPLPEPVRDDVGPLVGRNFGGYEIVSYIGDGPSGAVYRGEDLVGNAMAVKVLHAGLANRERTETLRDELTRLSALGEPVLQTIYDTGYGEEDQFFYATDELVGCDLETALEDSGGLAPSKSYEIVRAVCRALELAHAEGIVHGGLRPRNVFLVPAERGTAVKVLDFGAARLGGGSDRGILAGLPPYLAPEQIGRAGASARDVMATTKSDLFALGVLMHELFAGTLPAFHGGARAALDGRRGPAAPPSNVEPALASIILSLLEADPGARPSSATEVLARLDAWESSASRTLDPARPAVVRRRGPTTLSGSIGPDSTARMSKFDALALAQDTLPVLSPNEAEELELVETPPEANRDSDATNLTRMDVAMYDMQAPDEKRKTMTQNAPTNPSKPSSDDKDPNSSESVEASLEDFISQANASFPAADGWDLHTGDVELVDDDAGGIESAGLTGPISKMPAAQAAAAALAAEQPLIVRPRHVERTEVVSQPLPPQPIAFSHSQPNSVSMPVYAPPGATWTQNPLIVGGIVLGAVIIGASIMLLALHTIMPAPTTAQAPPQVIIQQPAAVAPAPAPAPAPAAAPVVTPLPPAAAPVMPAAAAAPVVTQLRSAPSPAAAPVRHSSPAHRAVAHKDAEPKKEAASEPKKETAAKPAKSSGKESKKGNASDWVDPFAN